MLLNYTYRIKPDQQQTQLLDEWLETLRVSYNYALRELKDWIASRKCPIDRCSWESEYIMSADYPFPSYHQQQNNLPKAKKEFPRLKSVPSQVLQTNIRRLHDAWDFFRQRGYGFPRFKKMGQVKSRLFPQFKTNPIIGWHIQLPKLGKVEINWHRPVPDGFIVKQVRVVKKAMGWFVVITLYSDIEIPKPFPHGYIETYPGTLEKQEIGSQVEVSGAMCLDNWRRGAMLNREVGKPTINQRLHRRRMSQ